MFLIILFLEIGSGGEGSPLNDIIMEEQPNPSGAATEASGEGETSSTADKAKAYLAAKKLETEQLIRAKFAEDIATYDAVRCFHRRKNQALDLYGSGLSPSGPLGDFFSGADGRMARAHLKVNFNDKSNISFSFDPLTMRCASCSSGAHDVLKRDPNYSLTGTGPGERIIFFLGDQMLPPMWAMANGGCPLIVRVEYGNLINIAETAMATIRGWQVPANSIFILSSGTRLEALGLGQYLAEFLEAAS